MALAAITAWDYGFWHAMDVRDETKISWLICAITVAASAIIGWHAYRRDATVRSMDRMWFISDAMVTLGMIGTVAGFLIMMGSGFTSIDVKDPAAIQRTIQTVGAGMGTIMMTTLMGLISSVLLKLQLVIVDHGE